MTVVYMCVGYGGYVNMYIVAYINKKQFTNVDHSLSSSTATSTVSGHNTDSVWSVVRHIL